MGREGPCKQMSAVHVGSAHSVWTTLGLPQPRAACAFWVYPAQAPGCSAGVPSEVGPAFRALPRCKLLRFRFSATLQGQTQLGVRFVPFLGPSSSGGQVLGERTVPGGPCVLITTLVPAAQFPGRAPRALSQVCRVSPLGS